VELKTETREFLTSRRARITPQQARLPWYGDNRRVPGLRREEVAMLAGVSVQYYTRLERGDLSGVSETVLGALAGALQLDDVERAHLFDLARAAQTKTPPRRRPTKHQVRPGVQRILDAMTAAPAYVRNGRGDILAANRLGYALYSPLYAGSARPVNTARFVFLDPHAADFFIDWDHVATEVVAVLRSEAGRDPYDRGLSELVGELSLQSEPFRTQWAAHNVRSHDKGTKRLHHPIVGELTLTFETMQLTADTGLTLAAYTAEPGSKSEEALNLLAGWTATPDQVASAHSTD
jgi:transcriptional regulator with XRE-family HTH domain